jgi:hypothetical protein
MIDISRLTPTQLDRFIHLQSVLDRQAKDAAKVRALRKYYDGEHPVLLTNRQQEYLGSLLTESEFEFAHNLTRSIIDTLRERLQVTGFTVNGESPDDVDEEAEGATPAAEMASLLWDWWSDSRLDAQQNRLYKRAMRDGKSYMEVSYDGENERPKFTLFGVDDGTVGITYHRDPEDPNHVLFANRYFYTGIDPLNPGQAGRERKTTYLPDQIRKYVRKAGADYSWEPYLDPGDAVWPLPWFNERTGQPLGIAIKEFENPDGSEVAQIIGLQNALNKAWLDLLAAADASGFPIVAVEYETPSADLTEGDDDLEGTDELRMAPGKLLEVDQARVHRLEPAQLAPMIEVIWTLTAAISGVSRTPQYYLRPMGGDVPSGEALKQLESGLVQRAEERQLVFGQAWADVMELAIKVMDAFGPGFSNALDELNIDVQWKDPEVRNEAMVAQTAEAHKRLEVPTEEIWLMLGYTPEKIASWTQAERAERATTIAQIATSLRLQDQRNQERVGATNGQPRQNGATQI